MSDVLEPREVMLGAPLRLAGGRGLALDRQHGGGYVSWAVYATADFDDGEPERLRDVTVAEAIALAPDRQLLIIAETLDAIAVLRLADPAGQAASNVVLRQSERLVDELVEAGLTRDTVLSLARRLSRAHEVARDLRGQEARETQANHEARTMGTERVEARPLRDLDRANVSAPGLAELLAGEDASRDEIERHPRLNERYRLEQRLRDLEAELLQTRHRLARLPPEYDTRFKREKKFHAVPTREPRRRWPSHAPRLVAVAGALALVVVAGLLILGRTKEGSRPKRQATSTQPPSSVSPMTFRPSARHPSKTQRMPPPTVPVNLSAIGAWDPYGDGREHDTEASAARDGNSGTYWSTETYTDGLQKPGVGLLLAAGRAVQLRRVVVTTETPGYSALIEAGKSSAGPFQPISRARTVATTTAFSLRARAERYYLIWITRLDHTAHVNEVRAFGH